MRALVGAAAVLQVWSLWQLAEHRELAFLGLHAVATLLTAVGLQRSSRALRFGGVLQTVLLPGAGAALSLLWLLGGAERPSEKLSLTNIALPATREWARARAQQLADALRIPSSLHVAGHEVGQLRTLVEQSTSVGPTRVAQLRAYMRNPRADTYHFAAAELARLTELFVESISAVREQLRAEPDNDGLLEQLADLYRDYAQSGLLDESMKDVYTNLALDRYAELCSRNPGEPLWRLARTRLLISSGRQAEAWSETERAIADFPEDPNFPLLRLQTRYFAAQRLDAEGWRGFREFAATLQGKLAKDKVHPDLRAAAEYWS
jgi:hypothetical protein